MSTHASAHPYPQSWTKTIIKGRNKACSRCHIRRVRCTGTEGEPCYACLRTAKARNHDLGQVYCGYRSASCSEEIFDHITPRRHRCSSRRHSSASSSASSSPTGSVPLHNSSTFAAGSPYNEAHHHAGWSPSDDMPSMSDLSHYTLPSHTLPPGVPSIGGGSHEALYRHRALPPPTSFDFYSPIASSCSAEFQARSHSLSNTNPLALLNFGSSSTLARSGHSIGAAHSGPTAPSHPSYQPGSALMEGPSNSSFEQNEHSPGPFFLPPSYSSRSLGSSLLNTNSSLHLPTLGFSQSSTRSTSGHLSPPTSSTIPGSTPTGPQTPGQPYYYPTGWSMAPQSQTPPSNQTSLPAPVANPGAVTSAGNCSATTASDIEWSNMLAATTQAGQSSPELSEAQVPHTPHSTRPQTPLPSPIQVHAAGADQIEATHRSSHPSPPASPP